MIIEAIFNAIFKAIDVMLSFLPDISWEVDGTVFDVFFDVLEMVCYLLPMNTIITIFGIVVGVTVFKAIVSLIKTIWDLLPIV